MYHLATLRCIRVTRELKLARSVANRVTRFVAHGSLFTLGSFLKITKVAHIFGQLYSTVKPGLPDFSWYKIPKWEKYTKLSRTIPNVHKNNKRR
jgi:hypothetical protein